VHGAELITAPQHLSGGCWCPASSR
jgi:hypothetical protein